MKDIKLGDIVEFQMDPNCKRFRYLIRDSIVNDRGPGPMIRAKVTSITPDNCGMWTSDIEDNPCKEDVERWFPLPDNPRYPASFYELKGWPKIVNSARIRLCDCGGDATFGDGGLHSSWCSKLK